jgi:HTH-type transcriptional regulator / antitoxin HigA
MKRLKISNQEEYNQTMVAIDSILQEATQLGGFQFLNAEQKADLARLSLLAEEFEDKLPMMPIKNPKTLPEMLRFKMYEYGWKQKQLAQFLGISEAKLSGLLSGQRKLNMELAKKLHLELHIDAHFILQSA